MIQAAEPQPDAVLGWMSCLSDATRVRLLRLVEPQELGVSDLCAVLQLPQSTVSRHLKVLAEQGWVTHRRQGTTHLYRLIADELTPAQRDLWRLTRDQVADWATLRQDAARLAARLASSSGQARAFFAGLAERWDDTRDTVYGPAVNAHALAALLAAAHPVRTVADFGCGTGALLATLAPHAEHVHGIDASPEMLTAAKARLAPHRNAALHEADLTDTPLSTDTADAALCVLALTYTDAPAEVVNEMTRVTRPGGSVVVIDLLRHDRDDFRRDMGQQTNGFAKRQLKQMLEDAGVQDASVTEIPPHPDATGPALLLATGSTTKASA